MELRQGSLFSERFQILSPPIKGGTAIVYKAFDNEKNTIIALKIYSNTASDPVYKELWIRETSALEKLKHKAIVEFVHGGTDKVSGSSYIAVEWLEGKALEDELSSKGAMSWDLFYTNYGEQILDALSHAFEAGIIHRDLSPNNIFVLDNGDIKLIDFGQSKIGNNIIGVTVSGFKTEPYCPPEPDTGKYTNSRDGYSFCAVALRAMHGMTLKNHDDLYQALESIKLSESQEKFMRSTLSRTPENRPNNIIEFIQSLKGPSEKDLLQNQIELAIRCAPKVIEKLKTPNNIEYQSGFDELMIELNDFVSIYPTKNKENTRFNIETESYKINLDIDREFPYCLVIIDVNKKHFKLDSLYGDDRWNAEISFTKKMPLTRENKENSKNNIIRFFEEFEGFLSQRANSSYLSNNNIFEQWSNLLDALKFIAKNKQRPLKYINIEVEGRRVTVELAPNNIANEGETRVIWDNGKPVFTGDIEDVSGNTCTLYSKHEYISIESIPRVGVLQIDWYQTKISIDRQRKALDLMVKNDIPNKNLQKILTLKDGKEFTPQYYKVNSFFDDSLDNDKKMIISRYLATQDLLLIHGPPGTGKTKLIAELVKQELSNNTDSKILLVSQTHVAVDNVLEKTLKIDPSINVIRIGSGIKNISENVSMCSVENKEKELKETVKNKTKEYIEKAAASLNIKIGDVELGIMVVEILKIRKEIKVNDDNLNNAIYKSEQQILIISDNESKTSTTRNATEAKEKLKVIEKEVSSIKSKVILLKEKLKQASNNLRRHNKDGKELSELDVSELSEWCDLLLTGKEQENIKRLIGIAEEFVLKIADSEDMKVALISSASIVAGTCVGFAKENAALSVKYDLCIIDEASKATTTELLVPIVLAKKLVLVGDHHQLPSVIDYSLYDEFIQERFSITKEQLENQLFEALQSDLADAYKAELTTQYRMRASIGKLVSDCFYDGKLNNGEEVNERIVPDLSLAGLAKQVTWFDTDPKCDWSALQGRTKNGSFYNTVEIDCIIDLLNRIEFVLANTKITNYEVAVITGYSNQSYMLNNELQKIPKFKKITVICDTVHAFQGREVDLCIYSITRNNKENNIGFLKEWKHLNVALSRARDYLVIVGGLDFCRNVEEPNPFSTVINHFDGNHNCEFKNGARDG